MKQVVQNYRTGELKVEELPLPQVKAGCVLVQNHHSLISAGTEKSTISVAQKNLVGKAVDRPDLVKKVLDQVKKRGVVDTMKMVFDRLDSPAALGYSCAGEVVKVGAGVERFKVGDRVACAGQNFASHAEFVTVPENLCNILPTAVSTQDACYVAIASIALQGVRQAEPKLGDVVAVIGVGLLGQLVVQFLVANGCNVIAYDIDTSKLKLAEKFGATSCSSVEEFEQKVAVLTQGQGADSVVITASTKSDEPVTIAGGISRKKGVVVAVGAVGMNIPREQYYLKELTFKLSTSYGPGRYDDDYEVKGNDYPYGYVRWTEGRNMAAFISMLEKQQLDLASLTTHAFDIGKAEEAYELIMENKEPYLGVLLSYESEKSEVNKDNILELRPRKTERNIQIGVIGAGSHIKDMIIPALKKQSNVDIAAVCTSTSVSAKVNANKLDAGYCTTDVDQILNDDKINAVVIGTPHNSHANLVISAINAGKHVFVEKPIALSQSEMDLIVDTYAKQNHLHLAVGFNRRHSSHIEKIKSHFAQVSDPLTINYRINAGMIPNEHWIQDPEIGGGRILGEMCHFVDTTSYIAESPIVSIYAVSIGHHSSGITSDKVNTVIEFENGSIGSISYCADGDGGLAKEYLEVFGGRRSAVMDDFKLTKLFKNGQTIKYSTTKIDKGFDKEMDKFVKHVLGFEQSKMTFDEIENVTRATFAIHESIEVNNKVKL